jgi:GST-like protein
LRSEIFKNCTRASSVTLGHQFRNTGANREWRREEVGSLNAIGRFAMEVKRQLDVLDQRVADNQFIAGDEYTIADMTIWPWYGNGMLNGASYNDPRKFLQTHEYKNLTRWTKEIGERPAVKRGRMVNRATGPLETQLHERHGASDFETRTQDKVGARG